jgi:hypothetical protein
MSPKNTPLNTIKKIPAFICVFFFFNILNFNPRSFKVERLKGDVPQVFFR